MLSDRTCLSRIWTSTTPRGLSQSLRNFHDFDARSAWDTYHWPSGEARAYVKSCLISSAVGLGQTWKLPEVWREELAAAGVIELKPDISWIRRERWANLDRLAPLETRA